jgi:hypothetical protein
LVSPEGYSLAADWGRYTAKNNPDSSLKETIKCEMKYFWSPIEMELGV